MDWNELMATASFKDRVLVRFINPPRKDEYFQQGEMCGYKYGVVGGGWNTKRTSFDSLKLRYIKKPKVCVVYPIFQMGKKPYMDWVDVDNCIFEIQNI